MPGVARNRAVTHPPMRRRRSRLARAAALLWAIGLAVPLLAQAQMNVGNPPPPAPPPQVQYPNAYPYPYGLAPRPKKKRDRCARAETPYERAACDDAVTSGTKARCGTDKDPC